MAILNTTPNRAYPEPALGNDLATDVGRLIAALRAIDEDVATALSQIVAKASLASPAFTGAPTAPTAAPGDDSGKIANTAFVHAAIAALVGLAPDALDTIYELASASEANSDLIDLLEAAVALKADATATTAALANRVRFDEAQALDPAQQGRARANIGAALKGHLHGLRLSNNAVDLVNDIDIAAGEAASDDSSPVLMVLGVPITKRLDAAWAAGSGNGGLDTGAIGDGTFHLWLIQRSDTGNTDVLFSRSATAPTMPANYDRKAYLWPIMRSGGAIVRFVQIGNAFWKVTPTTDRSSTAAAEIALLTLDVPTGVNVRPILESVLNMALSSSGLNSIASPNVSSSANVQFQTIFGNAIAAVIDNIVTNKSGQVYWGTQISAGTITANVLRNLGWHFDRGAQL